MKYIINGWKPGEADPQVTLSAPTLRAARSAAYGIAYRLKPRYAGRPVWVEGATAWNDPDAVGGYDVEGSAGQTQVVVSLAHPRAGEGERS